MAGYIVLSALGARVDFLRISIFITMVNMRRRTMKY